MPLLLITSTLLTLCLCLLPTPAAFAASTPRQLTLVGPKTYYLALGDSLAFGYQPNFDWSHGYVDDFFSNLKGHSVQQLANMGCPGETSTTMIKGGCPYAFLRKYPYMGAQLAAAVGYLQKYAGKVSPVTIDIGGNDLLPDINTSTCTVSSTFSTDLATLDANLKGAILPQLKAALTVNNVVTGDLVMMNYYDPYQNICPNTVPYIQQFDQHLARDMSGYGTIVNIFSAFGGAKVPNKHICTFTWMCSGYKDIHATSTGYSVIASTFENGTGY
jgi:lysophospholipase L1-like esterase